MYLYDAIVGEQMQNIVGQKKNFRKPKKRYLPGNKALYESETVGVNNRGSATITDGKGKPLHTMADIK